jgi:hypothetical protein
MMWRIHHMDLKISFINGIIEEEVLRRMDSQVCRLKKSLYGVKQPPMAWYSRIDGYLQSMGFTKSQVDLNLYFIFVREDSFILVMYVDDFFLRVAEDIILG